MTASARYSTAYLPEDGSGSNPQKGGGQQQHDKSLPETV